jgi:hypothetical protein
VLATTILREEYSVAATVSVPFVTVLIAAVFAGPAHKAKDPPSECVLCFAAIDKE